MFYKENCQNTLKGKVYKFKYVIILTAFKVMIGVIRAKNYGQK